MNWREIFNWYWEQKGVENPERFLSEEEQINELQMSDLQNMLNEAPNALKQMLGGNIKSLFKNNLQNVKNSEQIKSENEALLDDTPIEEKQLENVEN